MSHCLNLSCQKPVNPEAAKFCQTCGSKLLLGDRFRAFQVLGQGNASRTFLALDTRQIVDPRCIIKAFAKEGDGESFRKDVAQLDQIAQHPQFPDLLAYFERLQGQYLVQEFVQGQTLLHQLQTAGAWDESQIRALLQDVLPLLKFLHDHQIIHRDVKPVNLIRRDRDQKLVLVDFGAIKYATKSALQRTGTVVGSAEYIAPEQLMGKATYASDLYSLGATCVHLLTGLSPFDVLNSATGTWHWRSVSSPVSDELANVLDKLLANTLNQRYASASAVLKDLGRESVSVTVPVRNPPGPAKPAAVDLPEIPDLLMPSNWQCDLTLTANSALTAVAIATHSHTLITAGADPALQLWDLTQGTLRSTLAGHQQAIASLQVSPDGHWLASGSHDQTIKIWDLQSEQCLQTLAGHQGGVTALAFSADGQWLISGSRDKSVKLWDWQSAQCIHTFASHQAAVQAIAFDPQTQLIASGDAAGVVSLWHLATRELWRSLAKHPAAVNAVAISGQVLVSGSSDTTMRLRNLNTGGIFHILTGHLLPVSSVAIAPNAAILASGSHDSTLKLWDLHQGKLLTTLTEPTSAVEAIAFSADGTQLVSVGRDAGIWRWRCEGCQ